VIFVILNITGGSSGVPGRDRFGILHNSRTKIARINTITTSRRFAIICELAVSSDI